LQCEGELLRFRKKVQNKTGIGPVLNAKPPNLARSTVGPNQPQSEASMATELHEAPKRPQEEESNGTNNHLNGPDGADAGPALKRVKLDDTLSAIPGAAETASRPRVKGVAPIKEE
jgi:hypothetical protein